MLAREAGVGRAKRELGSKNAAGWGGVGWRWRKKGGGWGRRVAEAFNKGMFGQHKAGQGLVEKVQIEGHFLTKITDGSSIWNKLGTKVNVHEQFIISSGL